MLPQKHVRRLSEDEARGISMQDLQTFQLPERSGNWCFPIPSTFHPKTAPEADLKPKLIQIPLYNPTQSNPEREIIIQHNNNSNQSPIVT